MGILFVLIFYAIALTIAASVGAAVLGTACFLLTRKAENGRKRVVAASVFFPFACAGFAGAWFIAYAVINYTVFDRDPGLGDTWETPLPNGYALMMIDVTDEGTVYDPRTQPNKGGVVGRDDAVFGVRKLQVSGNLIFGARDSGYFDRIGQESEVVDSYFELDTLKKTHTEFKTLQDLQQHIAAQGATVDLRNIASVYRKYRFTWFDYFSGIVLVLVPFVGFLLLARRTWNVRRAQGVNTLKEAGL